MTIKLHLINEIRMLVRLWEVASSLLLGIDKINFPRRTPMNKKMFNLFLAGALSVTTALPLAVQAGRGGNGPMGQNGLQTQTGTRTGSQLRMRDGSCTNPVGAQSGTRSRSGKHYGPGDGSGNGGFGPQDGSGNGAPAGR